MDVSCNGCWGCDNVKESCPIFSGKAEKIHWSFFDPAEAKGDTEEILKSFREVRDQIKDKITNYFSGV